MGRGMCRFTFKVFFLLLLGGIDFSTMIMAIDLQDDFADRESVSDQSGTVSADNSGATIEAGEPRHADKRTGHSMWMTWIAPSDGIVSFSTDGSDFDTVLAAYFMRPRDGAPVLDRLREAARADDDDDDEGEIQFGVLGGQAYEIAVAGYGNDSGQIILSWNFISTTTIPPVVVGMPDDRSVVIGEPLTILVEFDLEMGSIEDDEIDLRWYFNGEELEDEESASLTIPSFQISNVGVYSLQLRIEDVRFFVASAEIQINSEGAVSVLARSKLPDAIGSRLSAEPVAGPGTVFGTNPSARRLSVRQANVSRGFSGSQIFSTVYALSQPGEPVHCDTPGGTSYWFAYEPPDDGILTVNTQGSTFPTILAVYTWNVADPQFSDLIPLGCGHAPGEGTPGSRVILPVSGGQKLAIVVDGVGGVTGIAHLNYNLDISSVVDNSPEILVHPSSQLVALGTDFILDVEVSGPAVYDYQWFKDGRQIDGATSPVLPVSQAGYTDSGDYVVQISRGDITVFSQTAQVHVSMSPVIRSYAGVYRFSPGQELVLSLENEPAEQCCFQWFKDGEMLTENGAASHRLRIPDAQIGDAGKYHFRLVTPVGSLTSPEINVQAVSQLKVISPADAGGLSLHWTASSGVYYILQASDRLMPANWLQIAEGQSDGGPLVFSLNPDAPVRYYRIVLP